MNEQSPPATQGSAQPPGDRPDPNSPRRGTNLAYLPGLDGVRGITTFAILGVHAGVLFCPGGSPEGFYLLDSFFTLSGFLITSLLIAEWRQRGTIRLGAFWIRRAKRLLAGLFLMVMGVTVLYAIVLPAGTYPGLRGDALASLFYFANWHFITVGSNYFNQTGLPSPLIHMWSLAVEEQFYFVWPLVFLAVIKIWHSLRALLVVCVVGALASATEMALLYNGTNQTRLYFGTDTHGQSVLVGCGLAAALAWWSERRALRPRHAIGDAQSLGGGSAWLARTRTGRATWTALGIAGSVGSVAMYEFVRSDQPFAYRGGFLVASTLAGLVLISVATAPRSFLSRFLSLRPFTYLGSISYGLYLWHLPLFVVINHQRTGLTGWPLFGVRFVITLAVASASFYLVERPVRIGSLTGGLRGALLAPGAAALAAVTVLASTIAPSAGASVAQSSLRPLPATAIDGTVPSSLVDAPVRVLLVGDSTALTLGFGLSEASQQTKYHMTILDEGILGCGVAQGTTYTNDGVPGAILGYPCMPDPSRGRCPPGGIFSRDQNVPCQEWPSAWQAWIKEFQPNVVVLLAGGSEVYDRVYRGRTTNILNPAFASYVRSELQKAVRVATSQGAVMVLMTAPCYDHGEQPDGAPWPEDDPARVAAYNRLVQRVASQHPGVVYVQDLHSVICPDDTYTDSLNGVQIRQPDGVHFAIGNEVGGDYLAPAILPYWTDLGHIQEATHGEKSIPSGIEPSTFAPA
jgi:peptidoglycan/LPS O-acetylase OafA/YrhL